MTQQSPWHRTSGPSQSRELLLLLSGEASSIPEAEARALVLMEDDSARFRMGEPRILLASTDAGPVPISSRVAFCRRVGNLVPDGDFGEEELRILRRGTYRLRTFNLQESADGDSLVSEIADRIGGKVSLENPSVELTIVRGQRDYLAMTSPGLMNQSWATRRPRKRKFFHPAAIFPKLSRALVNLTRVRAGETLLDPFCGTGSLLLEACEVGVVPIGLDIDRRMVRGALRNMLGFDQRWLGLARADVSSTPLRTVDAISTDVPYGRASSTSGSDTRHIIEALLVSSLRLLSTGRRLVLMHPRSVEVQDHAGFQLEEEHHLYIHRNLTRTISVFRRV